MPPDLLQHSSVTDGVGVPMYAFLFRVMYMPFPLGSVFLPPTEK